MDPAEPDPVLLPLDDVGSLYANTADIWWTAHDVVIDLYTVGPIDPEEGSRVATGVARVRLPRTIITGMLMHLSRALGPLDPADGRDAP